MKQDDRILCVDDDPNILQAYERALRRQFHIEPALGGEEALTAIREQGPYAVIVADMRMPGMTGVELLAKVREIAPDTVRMMLTGNADQQTALEAVNEGRIFRFMNKPCPPEEFAKALQAGIDQYHLLIAEHELLAKTLSGSVKVLTDVLSLISPSAFGRASRVRRLVRLMITELSINETWQIEIAAMLSQVGCVAVPEETLDKIRRDEEVSRSELEAYEAYPRIGAELISNIPRLEPVAEMIRYQEKRYDGQGFPNDNKRGADLPTGARILKLALDFDTLHSAGLDDDMALAEINDRAGWYDPAMVNALRQALRITEAHVVRRLKVSELIDGMVLADDVKSINGTLLCARGQEVTSSMRARLKTYVANVGLKDLAKVFVPLDLAEEMFPQHNASSE
ncbi:MAG: response regulator [Pirellulales bacterium]|nr:response regulator [Pirellulales bacterium]